jgi:hypothetical protein
MANMIGTLDEMGIGRDADALAFRIEERLTTGKIPAPHAVFAEANFESIGFGRNGLRNVENAA